MLLQGDLELEEQVLAWCVHVGGCVDMQVNMIRLKMYFVFKGNSGGGLLKVRETPLPASL